MVTFYRRLLLAPEIVSDFYLNRVGHDSNCQNKRQFHVGISLLNIQVIGLGHHNDKDSHLKVH